MEPKGGRAALYGGSYDSQMCVDMHAAASRPGVRFTWDPDARTWHIVFGSQNAKGEWRTVTDLRATQAK
jgi:hypothetical protein